MLLSTQIFLTLIAKTFPQRIEYDAGEIVFAHTRVCHAKIIVPFDKYITGNRCIQCNIYWLTWVVRLGPPLNIKIVFRNIRKTIRRSRDRLNRLMGISLYMYIFAVTIKKPYHLRKSISVTLYTTISSYIFASTFVRRHAILVWLVDVIKWKHFFSRYWPFMKRIHRWIPLTKPMTRYIFSLICAWTQEWANNRDAGDLRRHGAH